MIGAIAVCTGLACRTEMSPAVEEDAEARFARERAEMVRTQLAARDITDQRVLEAMGRVPRHRFVPAEHAGEAYGDHPLPIGHGQTISQPYIVALMTQLAQVKRGDRVLDIGTGSGYQAAVLAEMGADVASIEIVPELAAEAKERLAALNYKTVEVRAGDGYRGWPERAPFEAMILAAAAPEIPKPLIEQLAVGGRLVLPVGGSYGQELLVITKQADGSLKRETVAPVMFVPMTGEVREDRK
ncbi:MAG TPA: protein-L-isoaspartate(D-aspartate) O-methyltransferase [Tepidisphaeraceae bacterium]|nr:protein-L-isoaspartate(D-aspartate) O-methyltransferase [Tepidisphaeraceae bacterium]